MGSRGSSSSSSSGTSGSKDNKGRNNSRGNCLEVAAMVASSATVTAQLLAMQSLLITCASSCYRGGTVAEAFFLSIAGCHAPSGDQKFAELSCQQANNISAVTMR